MSDGKLLNESKKDQTEALFLILQLKCVYEAECSDDSLHSSVLTNRINTSFPNMSTKIIVVDMEMVKELYLLSKEC